MIAVATALVLLAFPPIVTAPAPTPDLEHASAIRAEQTRIRDLAAAREAAEKEAAARANRKRRAAAIGSTPHAAPTDPDTTRFLACTRAHESDTAGGYQATDAAHPGAEVNSGAYQFSQATWDATARHAGRPDLIGIRPDRALPADQDALAADLYRWQGSAPWGGRC